MNITFVTLMQTFWFYLLTVDRDNQECHTHKNRMATSTILVP